VDLDYPNVNDICVYSNLFPNRNTLAETIATLIEAIAAVSLYWLLIYSGLFIA